MLVVAGCLIVGVLLVQSVWFAFGSQQKVQDHPNVILIMTDDQGYGDVNTHGNDVIETPNLDRLHAESVRLTDFHVRPTCSPSRAALITGRYPTRTGVWHTLAGRSLLRRQETTIADVFADNGYQTAIFGKWHLGDNYPFRPQDRGFQTTLVHGGGGIGQVPDYWGNDYFDDHYCYNGQWEQFEGYCTDIFFGSALNYISKNRNEPFFVYLPTNIPHAPHRVPESYIEFYREKGMDEGLAKFYGMITHFDKKLGLLLKKLNHWGLEEETLLIFMTDNGTAGNGFNAGMRGRKGSVYDGGHRVPFFIRYPGGGLSGGRDVDALTADIDVMPTLIELANLNRPKNPQFDGTSFLPLLRGRGSTRDRTLFVHSQRVQRPKKWRNTAVMTDRWRLIRGEELYDIEADPGQQKNVADQYPDVVADLRQEYDQWWRSLSDQFDEYTRIIIGSQEENPTRLTAQDWHTDGLPPWRQSMLDKMLNTDSLSSDFEDGLSRNGFWAVEVARGGTYQFTLRQKPVEAAKPEPIRAETARIRIGDVSKSKPLPAGAIEAQFRIDLEAGRQHRLQTWLTDAGGRALGAFFVYVERIP